MPSLLDRLLGRDKKVEPNKEAPQRVSEEAARKRREELAAEKEAMKKARLQAEAREKVRQEQSDKEKLEKMAVEERARLEARVAAKPAAASGKTYVVKSGDSLSKIAKEVLGDAKRWPEIYELNKDLIGENPNVIHPGQKLNLPA